MTFTLFTYPGNPRAFKALIAAKYAGVAIDVPPFKMGVDNKTPEYLADVNPVGKVPALVTPDGSIFESNAIARFVARQNEKSGLYGRSNYEASQVDQWLDFATNEINLAASAWTYPILGYLKVHNAALTEKAKEDIRKALTVLNKHLLHHTFLVGERITLADIVVSCELYILFTLVLDPAFRAPFENVVRWYQTLVHQPNFQAVIGAPVLCEVARTFGDGKTFPAPAPASAAAPAAEKKEEKKPKEEKKKEEKKPKEEKPKEEKKAAAPAAAAPAAAEAHAAPAEDDMFDEDGNLKEEKKKPNPLDSLPPSSFNLDEFKRLYSNAKSTRSIFDEMWSKFDAAGWSWWFADYKYNDELSKKFMTSNLVGGWCQRLDKLRKYGFGNILIFGDEPKLEVKSSWLFRGQDVPAEMLESDDSEHYTWRKADVTNQADKELIQDFLAWEGLFGGKTELEADGKTFK